MTITDSEYYTIYNKAEAPYRRGDLFEKRRKLMEAWQAFAESKPMAKVLPPVARIERSS
jgi:hypothetical protein